MLKPLFANLIFCLLYISSVSCYAQTIDAGGGHTLKLCSNGSIISWGHNDHGQLGNDTNIGAGPLTVHNLSNAVAVSAGFKHSVALLANGTVFTWGYNAYGQLGYTSADNYTPAQIPNLLNITKIAAGGGHTIALKTDGTVWAWGANNWGQLGTGSFSTGTPTPAPCSNLTGVIDIAAGDNFCLALKTDSTVWAWGYNSDWELGDSAIGNAVNVPIPVVGLTSVWKISAGRNFSMALKNDSTVWTWGYDGNGMLGNGGAYLNQYTPTQVPGLNSVTAISAGFSHSLALKADGTVWAWGLNGSGELGTWNFNQSDTPVNVHYLQPLDSIAAISAGSEFSVATDLTGGVWSWGADGIISSNIPLLSQVSCSSVNAIEQLQQNIEFSAIPNPFYNQLTFTLSDNTPTTVTLYNFIGQQVLQQSFTNTATINTAQLANGIYLYELRNYQQILKTGKLVKQ